MKYIITIIVLSGFFLLAHASRHQEKGYDHSVFEVLSLKQRQAMALRELYQLTDDDIDKPIILW